MIAIESMVDKPVTLPGLDLDTETSFGPRNRVLVVDDEVDSIELIKTILIQSGMDVIGANSGIAALEKTVRFAPDIILLDINMPGMDGWQTFQELRKITRTPIIFTSANNMKEVVIRGLQFGVEDYITKPFHPGELVARTKTIIHRFHNRNLTEHFDFPNRGLHIYPKKREALVNNKQIYLTQKELDVLLVLAKNPSKWISNYYIAMTVWGNYDLKILKRIKYLVFLLRQKLEGDMAKPVLVLNRRGLGYKLDTGEPLSSPENVPDIEVCFV
jgi:DNA-binding response OmpR family regulator